MWAQEGDGKAVFSEMPSFRAFIKRELPALLDATKDMQAAAADEYKQARGLKRKLQLFEEFNTEF